MADTHVTVLVWVTHLLGTGHLFRTAAIVRALRRRGARVLVASGGIAVSGVDFADAEFIQLPAVRSPDATFATLVDGNGEPIDDRFLNARAELLAEILTRARPDVVLTELYPFGRRKFGVEVDRMLDLSGAWATPPLIVASIRDIPAPPSRKSQVDFAVSRLERHYDLVLVHGDPSFIRLERTFPLPDELSGLLRYTGYIGGASGRSSMVGSNDGAGEVVVSAGGGVVGLGVYEAALGAAALTSGGGTRWRILIGRNVAASVFDRLTDAAGSNATVEWARPDFPALLHRAAVSVSQAGYNTVADLLDAGVPAVLVPFADGGEQEQTIRAGLMAEAGRAVVLPSGDLSPSRLAAAVAVARALAPSAMRAIEMGGDERSAEIILNAARQRGQGCEGC